MGRDLEREGVRARAHGQERDPRHAADRAEDHGGLYGEGQERVLVRGTVLDAIVPVHTDQEGPRGRLADGELGPPVPREQQRAAAVQEHRGADARGDVHEIEAGDRPRHVDCPARGDLAQRAGWHALPRHGVELGDCVRLEEDPPHREARQGDQDGEDDHVDLDGPLRRGGGGGLPGGGRAGGLGSVRPFGSRSLSASSCFRTPFSTTSCLIETPVFTLSFASSAAFSYPMIGFRRVTIAVLISAFLRSTASFAVRPSMHRCANSRATFARISMDCWRLWDITGIIVLRSRFEWVFARDTVMSFPTTWAPPCITASGMTGFTFPGMIEAPGWTAGRFSSPSPVQGPEPSHRMSFAIFIRLTATVRTDPLASTSPSWAAWASKWVSAPRDRIPG